jgi:hypothetical protein
MARSEAWRSYAAGSEVRHFAEFAKTHLIQSEDRWEGKPLLLEPWQKRMLGEALAYDERGWPIWRSVTAGRESLSGGALPPWKEERAFCGSVSPSHPAQPFRRETRTLPGTALQHRLASLPQEAGGAERQDLGSELPGSTSSPRDCHGGSHGFWMDWKEAHQLIYGRAAPVATSRAGEDGAFLCLLAAWAFRSPTVQPAPASPPSGRRSW